jgi:hypothetical protein
MKIIRLAPSLAAILFVSCMSAPSVKPTSGTIAGITAAQSKVVVRQEQRFKFAGVTYVLTVGEYRPAYEDTIGIYYEAPKKLIQKEDFLGMHIPDKIVDGGIFLERANPKLSKIYKVAPKNEGGEIQRMLIGGKPIIIPRSPQAIQFQLIKS